VLAPERCAGELGAGSRSQACSLSRGGAAELERLIGELSHSTRSGDFVAVAVHDLPHAILAPVDPCDAQRVGPLRLFNRGGRVFVRDQVGEVPVRPGRDKFDVELLAVREPSAKQSDRFAL